MNLVSNGFSMDSLSLAPHNPGQLGQSSGEGASTQSADAGCYVNQRMPSRRHIHSRVALLNLVFPIVVTLLLALSPRAWAEPAQVQLPINPAGTPGTLVVCGGGRLPSIVRETFISTGGGKSCRLVIIPTATPGDDAEALADGNEVADRMRELQPESIEILHTRDRQVANSDDFVKPLQQATAVWITGGRQSLIAESYHNTRVEEELRKVLERGGVIGGTSAGAACMSRIMIVRGQIWETPGLGLIPGVIVDQHFVVRNRRERLFSALSTHPDLVGIGVDEGTALVVKGRELKCIGDSTVHLCLAKTPHHQERELILKPGDQADLTMYVRGARDRSGEPFPPRQLRSAELTSGSLVIVGGGGLTDSIVQRFIELAGGPDSLIVVLPIADTEVNPNEGKFFERYGARNVRSLTARTKPAVESDESLALLKQAKAVWFGGGRQWRFVDAYEGTRALPLIHDVLKRGGVIGGSSAGATIQGDYLVRGSPLGNTDMMALGYERGFAFLPGTAIDQHFRQRSRFLDLAGVVERHPQLLGIGLDERTAIVVKGTEAEVVGRFQVHFFDRQTKPSLGELEFESLNPGGRYDLKNRRVISWGEEFVEPASKSLP